MQKMQLKLNVERTNKNLRIISTKMSLRILFWLINQEMCHSK